jgi:hypothetical protein
LLVVGMRGSFGAADRRRKETLFSFSKGRRWLRDEAG